MLGLAEGAVQLLQWLSQGHSGKISNLFDQQGDLRVLIPGAVTRTISVNSLGFRRPHLTQLDTEEKKVSEPVVLVTFSCQIRPEQAPEQQLKAAGSALYYMPFMTPPGLIDAYSRYNRVITEVASETGDNEHFNDTVHFKDAGSQVMACPGRRSAA